MHDLARVHRGRDTKYIYIYFIYNLNELLNILKFLSLDSIVLPIIVFELSVLGTLLDCKTEIFVCVGSNKKLKNGTNNF